MSSVPRKYPPELKQRSVRLVLELELELEAEDQTMSRHAAVRQIAHRVGAHPDTLRTWCRQAEIDAGTRPGVALVKSTRVKELEREVKELKRANEILWAASSFFARELDPRLPW